MKSKVSFENVRKSLVVILWIVVIILFFVNRHKITLDNIVNYTPENISLAILVILFLFFFKSIVFFIYGGLIYAASGVIFPFPIALAVNLAGTFIMSTTPFLIGKMSGSRVLSSLVEKHPRLKIISEIQKKNEFFVSFFARIVGLLPADVVSLYMGASLTDYKTYIFGTMMGFLPSVISFTIMGTSADNITSLPFITSVIFEICLMGASLLFLYLYRRHKNKK